MESNGLELLQPESKVVKVNGEDIVVKPFKFKNLFEVLKLVYVVFSKFDFTEELDDAAFFGAVINESDAVIKIMSIAIKKDVSYFDEIEADEALDLAHAIFTINRDFFTQKLWPKLREMLPKSKPEEEQSSPTNPTTLPENQLTPENTDSLQS